MKPVLIVQTLCECVHAESCVVLFVQMAFVWREKERIAQFEQKFALVQTTCESSHNLSIRKCGFVCLWVLNSVQILVFNLQKRLLLVHVIRTFKHLKLVNETSYWAGSCG